MLQRYPHRGWKGRSRSNEKFITGPFINCTKSENLHRDEVPFAIAFDSDLRKVPLAIQEAVVRPGKVLKAPAPKCQVKSFAERGVSFGVDYWVAGTGNPASNIHFLVWDAPKAAGVALAPPKP